MPGARRGSVAELGAVCSPVVLGATLVGLTLCLFSLQPSACRGAMSSMGFVTSPGNASKFAKVALFFFLLSFYT